MIFPKREHFGCDLKRSYVFCERTRSSPICYQELPEIGKRWPTTSSAAAHDQLEDLLRQERGALD